MAAARDRRGRPTAGARRTAAVYGQPSYGPPPYQQQYQAPYQGQQYQPAARDTARCPTFPATWVGPSLTLILCFWPTGIVAVVYASQVGNKLAVGDYAGAVHSSQAGPSCGPGSAFGIGVAGIVIAVISVLIAAAASITVY